MWACDPAVTGPLLASYQPIGQLFVQILQGFLAAQCALAGDHVWPADATDQVLQDPNYDFIIVGAGSAGSVLANRLSEVPEWKVLLVEAGGNPSFGTLIPQMFFNLLNGPDDWGYRTVPHEGACQSYDKKSCAWPRGKTLGGCSAINAQFYVRGNKLDYDEWAASGNYGWSYDDVLPYFKKSQNFTGHSTDNTTPYHATGGYLTVEDTKNINDIEKLLIGAAQELGITYLYDINGKTQMGVTRSFSTTKNGVRESTASAFLKPIKDRKNLHVIKNALATKILFKTNSREVDGVVLIKNGKEIIVRAKKEVIVSAGAVNSPQLLMLSGIGPQKHLEEFDIEVKVDLPVGENLQDHLFVPTFYIMPGGGYSIEAPQVMGALMEFVLYNKGLFADTSPHKIVSFINTTDSAANSPDIQFHYVVLPPGSNKVNDIFANHGLSDEFRKNIYEANENNFLLIVAEVLLRPKSRGRIALKSADHNDYPLIYANYFQDPEDMKTILRGLKQHTLKLGDTESFQQAGLKRHWVKVEACKKYEIESDDFLECIARETTFSLYHPTCSVKMGPLADKTAVLDPELRVKGVKNLRVADASVMPDIVRGNTNAPTIMIAERAADMIKSEWRKGHTEL